MGDEPDCKGAFQVSVTNRTDTWAAERSVGAPGTPTGAARELMEPAGRAYDEDGIVAEL